MVLMDTKTKPKRQLNEFEFIISLELKDRTQFIQERDSVSYEIAKNRAFQWISDEIGLVQGELFSQPSDKRYYKLIYKRVNETYKDDEHSCDIAVRGTFHNWENTNRVLADLVRDDLDPLCNNVIVFYEIQKPDYVID